MFQEHLLRKLLVRFQNSVEDDFEYKEIYNRRILLKMVKYEADFILIGFEFPELEGKDSQLNIGNKENCLNVLLIRN